ncbi:hypothetical protein A2U01_0116926, partial [Trifolium medium]|nr:hypothetical protein [Trifolium medium]
MVIQHERQYNASYLDESKVLINANDARRPQGRGRGGNNGSSSQGNRSNTFGAKKE